LYFGRPLSTGEKSQTKINMSLRFSISNKILLVCLVLISAQSVNSQTRLPAIIGSNMVLQQQVVVPVWGWDNPGQQITLKTSWGNHVFITRCSEEGYWKIPVQTTQAGNEPQWIKIVGSEEILLENILIGEVWLCSGQSNMEMPVKGWDGQPIIGSEEAISSANYPDIRLFTVARKTSYDPLDDCEGSWDMCSPETVPDFSATGYFFGLEIYEELGIPIGLIHSSWGGTPAEAWTSSEYINQIPYFQTKPGECIPPVFRQVKLDAYQIVQDEWLSSLGFLPDDKNPPKWVLPEYEDKYWEKIKVPAKWEDTRLGRYTGLVEFRSKFKAPRKWLGKTVIIELGPIDEIDITWVNGLNIGSHPNPYSWNTPRIYEIPAGILRRGKNTLAVQVGNTSGAGGIFGSADQLKIYPKGEESVFRILKSKWLARKSQSYGEVVEMPYCHNCGEPGTPTTLYNGMINPLIPFRIKGAIWYQGESNRMDGLLYNQIFPNMINCWRNNWNQGDFPFYYVQIAPYTYRDDFNTGHLKEAQQNALFLSNTGMVTTGDIGDLVTIHPPDKKSVGKRLAFWALAKDYGKDIYYSGPLFREYRIEGNKIRIIFDYACDGLKIEGNGLKHIQIAGRDRIFKKALAKIEGETLVVFSPDVKAPVAVRFGWGSTDQTSLFNIAGLPAGPFRTDRWDD